MFALSYSSAFCTLSLYFVDRGGRSTHALKSPMRANIMLLTRF